MNKGIEMECAEVMKEIASKLSGDRDKDITYLSAEAEKYQNHKYAVEIHRGILRTAYDISPENDKSHTMPIAEALDLYISKTIKDANIMISEGRLSEAETVLKSILPRDDHTRGNEASDCFWFNELMEEMIYRCKYNPDKETLRDPYGNSKIYFTYACILYENKKYDDALKILEYGLKFNPVNVELLVEESEIFKLRKDWATYRRITDMFLEYSYKSNDVARAFRNYGFMLIEQADYDAAICCYLLSLYYDNNEIATSELHHISNITRKPIDQQYYFNNMNKILKDRGFDIGPSSEIVNLAYYAATNNEEEMDYKYALYFYKICFDLTKDEKMEKKIDVISNILLGVNYEQ